MEMTTYNVTFNSNTTRSFSAYSPLSLFFYPALVLSVIGLPGTIFSTWFYGRFIRSAEGATNVLLMTVAIYDTLCLLTNIPFIGLGIHMLFVDNNEGTQMFFCNYYITNYLSRFPKYCSNLVMIIVAMERLYSVVRPHKVKVIFTRNIGLIYAISITVIIPLTLLLNAMEYECAEKINPVTGATRIGNVFSEIGTDRLLFKWLYILTTILYFCIPLLGVLVCNIGVVVFLLYRVYSKKSLLPQTNSQARQLKTTRLVLAITCIFIVCVSPLGIFYPLRGINNNAIPVQMYQQTLPISTFLESVNYSSNTLVYYIGSNRFRDEIKRRLCHVVCKCKTSKVNPILQSDDTKAISQKTEGRGRTGNQNTETVEIK